MLSINARTSSRELETQLQQLLHNCEWIGELPIDEDDFKRIGVIVRGIGITSDEIKVDWIPPLTLVTSMVFCARYYAFGDDEHPQFWRPYAKVVWGLTFDEGQNSQGFQAECRKYFRKARTHIEEEYGFYFPHKTDTFEQDVVGGIYTHAIIPSYLIPYMGEWLSKLWGQSHNGADFVTLPLDMVLERLRQEPSLRYVVPRLRQFVENDETGPTAARLVQTLANATALHAENGDSVGIESQLSPIERPLWLHLVREIGQPKPARKYSTRLEWAWAFDDTDVLALRVKNLRFQGGEKPDRCVWLDATSTIESPAIYQDITPWQTAEGWELDPVLLPSVTGAGAVQVVDIHDRPLMQQPIPVSNLPTAPFWFFRIVEGGTLSVQTPLQNISSGEWIVSLGSGAELRDKHGAPLQPFQRYRPPEPLDAQGHTQAGRYHLDLPVQLWLNGRLYDELRGRRIDISATVEGRRRVAGLASGAPQAFEDNDIVLKLHMASPKEAALRRLSIRLTRVGHPSIIYRWDRLEREFQFQQNQPAVSLRGLIPHQPGIYQLELFSGVDPITPEPLRFSILRRGTRVSSPDLTTMFTPQNLPALRIEGVSPREVQVADSGVVTGEGGSVVITWRDPRQACRVQLNFDGTVIPLEWAVRWSYAWAEPLDADGTVLEEELANVVLHLRGNPKQQLEVVVGSQQGYPVYLNARGQKDLPIGHDRLYDMLREESGDCIQVEVSNGLERWKVMQLLRPHSGALSPLARMALHTGKAHTRGNSSAGLYALMALPLSEEQQASALYKRLPLLAVLRDARQIPLQHLIGKAIPQRQYAWLESDTLLGRLRLKLDSESQNSGKVRLELSVQTDQGRVTAPLMVDVRWTEDNLTSIHLSAPDTSLFQCRVCGEIFRKTNTGARIRHSHGTGKIDFRDLDKEPLIGSVTYDYRADLEHFSFVPSAIFDRSILTSYRIRKDLARKALVDNLYTAQGYRHAVAEWSLNLETPQTRQALEALTSDEVKRLTSAIIDALNGQRDTLQTPALIAIHQFLSLFHRGERWDWLDVNLLVLALVCRAQAYPIQDSFDWERLLPAKQLTHLLALADHACPRLLRWAFTWIELFFFHLNQQS